MLSYSFRTPLQLGLFPSKTVPQRITVLAKMIKGIKSRTENQNVEVDRKLSSVRKEHDSSTRRNNFPQNSIDVSEDQTECLFNPANEHEFPPLSAGSSSKGKRRSRYEGVMEVEQKIEQRGKQTSSPQPNNDSLESHSESYPPKSPPFPSVLRKKLASVGRSSPTISGHTDESTYRTGFQERQSPPASVTPNLEKSGPPGRATPENTRVTSCRPFDICFYPRRQLVPQRPAFPVKEQCAQMDGSVIENGEILRPGMVLFKSYLPLWQQVDIILKCRELGIGPGGFYQPVYKDGAKLCLQMMCLGMDWDPQTRKYGSIRQHDNSKPPNIPLGFIELVKRAIHDAHTLVKKQTRRSDVEKVLPSMAPDICIVNFYTTNGRLGLHQDRDESRDSIRRGFPVVSFSIGDSAEFLYGDERDIDKAERVKLESGDVLIFGGESRRVFHGVTSINPRTTPEELLEHTKLRPGRLNLTFRHY